MTEPRTKLESRQAWLLAWCALLASGGWLAAQQAPPQKLPATVLRVTTRLVLVDVVVTDKKGRPVTDLSQEEFALLENGRPQQIAVFSLTAPAREAAARPVPPPLPAHTYTNKPEYHQPPGPLTILLLDMLNTPVLDQAYARDQMLRYLTTQVQPDQRIAIMALTNSLLLLQDFTSDPRLLQAALKARRPQPSVQLAREQPSFNPDTIAQLGDVPPTVLENIERFEEEQAAAALDIRVATTLAALQAIADATAGYSGRKNLIWVSAAFPFAIIPEEASSSSVFRSYADEMRRTAAALTDAQVAVYPVDARGLVGYELGLAAESGRDRRGRLRMGPGVGEEILRRSRTLQDSHSTMREIAEDTGGRAFVNRNDIDAAVALSVADGSTYYTLGYYPEKEQWDGKFRKIDVKLARKGLALRHRRGYYAADPSQVRLRPARKKEKKAKGQAPEKSAKDLELLGALYSPLPATLITFQAHVPPPVPAARATVPIEFLVDSDALSFEADAQGRQYCSLDFLAAAFTPDGRVAAHLSQTLDGWLGPDTYPHVRQQGLRFQMQLELEPGRYLLRLLVRDNRTGMLGSTDIPLVLEKP